MPIRHNIQIVFAPLPEEESDVERSASKEFARRTVDKFRNAAGITDGDARFGLEIAPLAEWKKDLLVSPSSSNSSLTEECNDENGINTESTVVVFLISCGPDGSVHRSVRKTTKWIKEQISKTKTKTGDGGKIQHEDINSDETLAPQLTTGMVALLGHSVCKTSAEQMEDEVFSSGRRLAKSLQSIIETPRSSLSGLTGTKPSFLLETHIELEPPEEKFDAWVESWIEFLSK